MWVVGGERWKGREVFFKTVRRVEQFGLSSGFFLNIFYLFMIFKNDDRKGGIWRGWGNLRYKIVKNRRPVVRFLHSWGRLHRDHKDCPIKKRGEGWMGEGGRRGVINNRIGWTLNRGG